MDSAQKLSNSKVSPTKIFGKSPLLATLIFIVLIVILGAAGWLYWYYGYLGEFGKVAAVVNGQKISSAFVEHQISVKTAFYTQTKNTEKLKTVRKEMLDWVVNNTLAEQELKKNNIEITSGEIEKALQEKANQAGGMHKFKASLEPIKMTMDDQRYYVKTDFIYNKLKKMQIQKHMLGIWFKRDIAGDAPEKTTPAQKAADKELLTKVQGVLKEATSGTAFSTLVEKYSEDPVSKAKKGEIGNYPEVLTARPSPFPGMAVVDGAYRDLSKGQVKLYTYPTGYAIIKVDGIKEGLGNTDYNTFIKSLRSKADIKTF